MFPEDSDGCFDKRPQHETEPSTFCLSFPAEILECLLHRLAKRFPEFSRIESEEFLVKGMNCPLSIRHVQNLPNRSLGHR